ncbi:MAG: hypothetical protein O7H39_11285 [Gammaproteobacteria bacterium]|nr:hypothetical protein [Gammaproteobacteria bacterium]
MGLATLVFAWTALGAESTKAQSRRCLTDNQFRNVRVIDANTIIFTGRGGKAWVNMTKQPCIGAGFDDQIVIDRVRAGRSCESDRIDIVRRNTTIVVGRCRLGVFDAVDSDEVDLIVERAQSER